MKSLYFTAILLLSARFAYPQASPNNNLGGTLEKLAAYHETYPRENVYLHLDKPYYTVGDDIWFKAYLTAGPQHLLSAISRIVYVELIDPDNRLVRSLRLPVVFGLSMGDFRLTDSLRAGGLREGNYRIRAYTNWMRNFDQDAFFDKTIPVGNVLTDKLLTYTDFSYDQRNLLADIAITELGGRPVTNREVSYELEADGRRVARGKATTDQQGKVYLSLPGKLPDDPTSGRIRLDIAANETHAAIPKIIPVQYAGQHPAIRFFPESGSLLAGVTGKVGFKALQSNGKGIGAHGYIADNNGQRVTEFQTGYAGMGHLLLTPEEGKTYTAHVSFADSSTTEVALPAVLTSGYALSVNNTNDQAVFLKTATTAGQTDGQPLALIAQKDGKVCYTATLRQNKPEMAFRIERQGLPAGVIRLTLLNEQLRPVAERVIFNINPQDTLPVALVTDKAVYKPREKVTMKLTAGTAGDSLRVGSFSVAVTDLGKVTDRDSTEGNILSGLLLSPELKGYIETPGYYFRGMDIAKKQQLDNLMLTQGWRKISWNDLMAGNLPEIRFQPEESMRISGRVVKKTGTPAPNASLTLFSPQDLNATSDTLADDKGRFAFDHLVFFDSTKLVLRALNQKDKQNVDILLDKVPEQPIGKNKNAPDVVPDINRSISDYLKSRKEHFDELQKHGLMDLGYLLDEVTVTAHKKPVVRNSANILGVDRADQVIYGKELANCRSLEVCLKMHLSMNLLRTPTLILVDGMQVFDVNVVKPRDVEAIELLRRPEHMPFFSVGGAGVPGSVLVITTKYAAGNFRDMYVPGIVTLTSQGLYNAREFYTPDYSRPQEHPELRDLRSTIFWGPGVTTDENGETSFEFYTADSPGRYRILVEGINAAGRIARTVRYMEVE